MLNFTVIKQSSKSRARLGILKTSHGEVETPCLVPVATQAVVKTLTSEETVAAGSQILIANTYHLHLQPGEHIVKRAGRLHKFMHWDRPLMTDSGGFQVFSLGFGRDRGMNKMKHGSPPSSSRPSGASGVISHLSTEGMPWQARHDKVERGQQPKLLKITDEGVHFTSYRDGTKLFIGPKESMAIQAALGADIIFAFDECPPPTADYAYLTASLARTHHWEKICLKHKSPRQALYGIVQGGRFEELRLESAHYISSLPFDGFGIGGEFGNDKSDMGRMLATVMDALPAEKHRHLLGVGHPEDIELIIKAGVDTFDCTVPTHYARHGIAFTSTGRLDMQKSKFLTDKNPLDRACTCFVCQTYRRNYITHLLRAREITALTLLTFHNLSYFHQYIAKFREKIKHGTL